MISKEEYVSIKQLHHQGYNIAQIARALKINRKTVRRHLKNDEYCRYNTRNRKSQLEKHREYLQARLKEYPLLSSIRLFGELKERGYTAGYRLLCKYVRKLRPPAKPNAFIRVETSPGKQAQADWAEFPRTRLANDIVDLHCFVIILSYSRNIYIEFCADEKQQTFQNSHIHAFEYFGGVPMTIRYDNMRQVVARREKGKPVINEGFKDFAAFYKFKPEICLPYHKEAKGKVERVIRYIRENFFYARNFRDMEDINNQAQHWLDDTANKRFNKLYGGNVADLLESEKLLPLPRFQYDTRIPHLCKVNKDCLISYQGNFYSIPYIYAGKVIEVQDDGKSINCLSKGKSICVHLKCHIKKGQLIINPDHYEGLRNRQRYVELISNSEFILTASKALFKGFDSHLSKYPGFLEEVQHRDLDIYERLING
jgi:transposase